MKKTCVLHLIDSNGMYGAETVVLTLLDNLEDSSYYCILGCIRQFKDEEVELGKRAANRGIHVVYFTMKRGLNFLGIFKIFFYIMKNNIEIIHSHGYKPNIFLGLLPRKLLKVKVISTIHGLTKEYADWKLRIYERVNCFFLKSFLKCIAVSNSVYNDMINRGISPKNIIIIHNGINLRRNKNLPEKFIIKNKFNIPMNTFIIGTAGRLLKEKGVDVFIKGASYFLQNKHNVIFLITGDGPLLPQLKEETRQLSIESKVLFLGFIDDIYEYLSILDIFVLSSLTEGLPIILLEAMNAGCSVVCSNVGGIPEVINNKEDGLLIKPNDPHSLSEKLQLLYDNKSLRNKITLNAKNKVNNFFSSKKMASEYINLYAKLS